MVRARAMGYRVQGFVAILFIIAAPHVARAQAIGQDTEMRESALAPAVDTAAATPVPAALATRIDHPHVQFAAWSKDAGAMLPLYSGFAALQVLDVQSTTRAIAHGATEQNAMLGGMSNHAAALTLLKSVTVASTVYAMEHVRKKNRLAAVVTMVALDSVYAAIVVHNYRAVR